MIATPKLVAAFPDFDVSTLPAIPEHWVDSSWKNEATPTFTLPGCFIVFVDYLDTAKREHEDAERFSVFAMEGECIGEHVLSTDDWSVVLAAVA